MKGSCDSRFEKKIADRDEVRCIFVFFCEEGIRKINLTSDMFDGDEFCLNLFSDGIFSDLNVAEALGGVTVRPGDAGSVVVVDSGGLRHVGVT